MGITHQFLCKVLQLRFQVGERLLGGRIYSVSGTLDDNPVVCRARPYEASDDPLALGLARGLPELRTLLQLRCEPCDFFFAQSDRFVGSGAVAVVDVLVDNRECPFELFTDCGVPGA